MAKSHLHRSNRSWLPITFEDAFTDYVTVFDIQSGPVRRFSFHMRDMFPSMILEYRQSPSPTRRMRTKMALLAGLTFTFYPMGRPNL